MAMGRRIVFYSVCAHPMESIKIIQLHAKRRRNIPTGLVKLKEWLHTSSVAGVRERDSLPAIDDTAIASELLFSALFKLGIAAVGSSILGLAALRSQVRVYACPASNLRFPG